MVIQIIGKDKFDALTGKATGDDTNITYTLEVSGSDLSANSTTYKNIGTCYVLPEEGKENFSITYSIYGVNDTPIRENVTIDNVPLENNFNTNVVGGLLTGTVTYTITFEQDFDSNDNNETIE